jgi:hypothetical protein
LEDYIIINFRTHKIRQGIRKLTRILILIKNNHRNMCSWLPARNENLLGLTYCSWFWLEVSKKTEKPIKPRKPEKNNRKNRTVKKKLIKPIKFWKNRPVRFYKPTTEKTELNPNRKKTRKKTEPNRKKLNQTGLNRFCPKKSNRNRSVWTGFGFFYK